MEFRPPVELGGRYVRLVPLAREHAGPLWQAAGDPTIWRYMRTGLIHSETEMGALIDKLLVLQRAGGDLPFTVLLRAGDRPVGMTRYLDIQRAETTVEVGGTWYGPRFQRTPVNTDCKLTMLRHAFEVEGAHRVQIRTDLRNERSQRAIERLGAVREGVLREHLMMPDGVMRSSVCYSILAPEWPTVRARLERLLDRPWTEPASPA
jgi:RimJ/RimL family protein N-acetyltransferase